MGVRRISVGGTLARVGLDAFIRSAREIAEQGKFDSFAGIISNPELNAFFREDGKRRATPEPQRGRPDHRPADRPARRHDAGRPASRRRARRALRARREARSGAARRGPVATPCAATTRSGPTCPMGRSRTWRRFPPGSTSAQARGSVSPTPASSGASGRAVGIVDADGDPPGHAGDRGRPHRLSSGAAAHAARHRGAVPAGALRIRDARATGATNGSATLSTRPRAARRCVYGFTFEGIFRAAHDQPRAATATPPGSPCSTANGRRANARSSAGSIRIISIRTGMQRQSLAALNRQMGSTAACPGD